MISKKEWYAPRIGFGLRPITWEGWVYVIVAFLLFIAALNLPIGDMPKIIIAGIILLIFIIDSLVITASVYADLTKKEKKHHHIIESSVSYVGIFAIVIVVIYKLIVLRVADFTLIFILALMVLTRMMIFMYLFRK